MQEDKIKDEFWNKKDDYGYSLTTAIKGGDLTDIKFAKELINPKLTQALKESFKEGQEAERRELVKKFDKDLIETAKNNFNEGEKIGYERGVKDCQEIVKAKHNL